MNLRNQVRFAIALTGTNIKASWALRGTFFLKSFLMFGNNIIFFSVWWIYFHQFKSMNGWMIQDMEFIYGMGACAFGLFICFGDGARLLSRHIIEGDLDSYLSQPKNPLLHTIGSRSNASGWGDVLTGLIFFGLSGYATLYRIPLIFLMIISGTLIFLATQIFFQSLAFWAGDIEGLAQRMTDFTITFSVYPNHIFPGWIRFLMFTVVPSGFITYIPVEIVRDFRWWKIFSIFCATFFYSLFAIWTFNRGLRRYESGNRIGVKI